MQKRTKILVIGLLGLLLGAMVGYFADWLLGPSHGDIRSAARSLVPDGAKVVREGENSGHHLIVGKYFALVYFNGGGPDETSVAEAVQEVARSQGWRETDKPTSTFATVSFERGGIDGSLTLSENSNCDAEGGATVIKGVCGEIETEHTDDSIARFKRTGVIVGGLLGGVIASLLALRGSRSGVAEQHPPLPEA